MFAGEHLDAYLPLAYFQEMQKVCLQLFPDWENNPQIRIVDQTSWSLFKSMETHFDTQKDLEVFIQKVKREFS